MAESRKVGCCGADTWTKVIAWLQIVLSTILILALVVILIIHFVEYIRLGNTVNTTTVMTALEAQTLFNILNVLRIGILATLICIVLAVCTFAMAIFLSKGPLRNPYYVMVWLVYTIIFGGGLVISLVVKFYWGLLVQPIIFGFILWVVFVFKKELDADQCGTSGRVVSVVYKA